MKSPPVQYSDAVCHQMVEEFIAGSFSDDEFLTSQAAANSEA